MLKACAVEYVALMFWGYYNAGNVGGDHYVGTYKTIMLVVSAHLRCTWYSSCDYISFQAHPMSVFATFKTVNGVGDSSSRHR